MQLPQYINDVHRPIKKLLKKKYISEDSESKKELGAARIASIVFTVVGILATIPFNTYPTVYEAHGYFHSTLTPPLVTAIFLGVFWKKFTPAGVVATFLGGSSLMILGARYPGILIAPFSHGTPMDPIHPYTYISALYNTFVCVFLGVFVTFTQPLLLKVTNQIRRSESHKKIIYVFIAFAALFQIMVWFNLGSLFILLVATFLLTLLTAFAAAYSINYDPKAQIEGLTAWSIHRAKEIFKGGKVNEHIGEIVKVHWKLRNDNEDYINVSHKEMKSMEAEVGDLIYLCDARKYLGGLKSVHTKLGKPHNEESIVYIGNEHKLSALFQEGKILYVEKEM
ncbi:MAG: hypothetical protein WC879_08805 [Melioribacteraceae bacterium]